MQSPGCGGRGAVQSRDCTEEDSRPTKVERSVETFQPLSEKVSAFRGRSERLSGCGALLDRCQEIGPEVASRGWRRPGVSSSIRRPRPAFPA